MKLLFLLLIYTFLCDGLFLKKNFLKARHKSKKSILKFKNYEISKEGWLKICVNPKGIIPSNT